MKNLPCVCFHSKQDHKNIGTIVTYYKGVIEEERPAFSWCLYSETHQCPCEFFIEMTNLEYLEYRYCEKYNG